MSPLPILTFHSLDDRHSVISFPPDLFRRCVRRLHENGYRTLGLTEAVSAVVHRHPVADRSFVITFDDGYRSVYEQALPVLQDHGMCATIFLTGEGPVAGQSGCCTPVFEERPMLSWTEIRQLANYGFSFGAHTLTHPDLTRLPAPYAEREICRSKQVIEEELGLPIDAFAYPYGRYDRQSREIVRRHFACACSDKLGLVTPASDVFALERVDAYYLRTERLFDLMLGNRLRWYLAGRNIPRRIRRALLSRIT